MSDKHPCIDLTPNDDCNKTCCPDYSPDSDWCKAFNKRTLEQQKETTKIIMDGIWFNIEDAKNTIGQAEQYLAMIYELLLAAHDQVMKVSSSTARTEGDFESASNRVKEIVKEIESIVRGAQYNGRHLLQNTKADDNEDSGKKDSDNNPILEDDKRGSIVFRLAGPRGFCRNVNSSYNDFTYELPPVGPTGLGLDGNQISGDGNVASTATGSEHNYLSNGLGDWIAESNEGDGDDEGIVGPDDVNQDNVDQTVTDFNCAIKTVGVELDKLRSYRYILCLREKQVRIWKAGQDTCFDHKARI